MTFALLANASHADTRDEARKLLADLNLSPEEVADRFDPEIFHKWNRSPIRVFILFPAAIPSAISACADAVIDNDLKTLSKLGGPVFLRTSAVEQADIYIAFTRDYEKERIFPAKYTREQVLRSMMTPALGNSEFFYETGLIKADGYLAYYFLRYPEDVALKHACNPGFFLDTVKAEAGGGNYRHPISDKFKQALEQNYRSTSELIYRITYGADIRPRMEKHLMTEKVKAYLGTN